MFNCPICGRALFGGLMWGHKCPPGTVARIERERREFDDDGTAVHTHCNVCGRKLHTADEDKMGMCEGCASE